MRDLDQIMLQRIGVFTVPVLLPDRVEFRYAACHKTSNWVGLAFILLFSWFLVRDGITVESRVGPYVIGIGLGMAGLMAWRIARTRVREDSYLSIYDGILPIDRSSKHCLSALSLSRLVVRENQLRQEGDDWLLQLYAEKRDGSRVLLFQAYLDQGSKVRDMAEQLGARWNLKVE